MEVLIVMQLGLIITGLSGQVYLWAARLVTGWERKADTEQQLNALSLGFTSRLERISRILEAGPQRLSGLDPKGKEITLTFGEGNYPGEDKEMATGRLRYLAEGVWQSSPAAPGAICAVEITFSGPKRESPPMVLRSRLPNLALDSDYQSGFFANWPPEENAVFPLHLEIGSGFTLLFRGFAVSPFRRFAVPLFRCFTVSRLNNRNACPCQHQPLRMVSRAKWPAQFTRFYTPRFEELGFLLILGFTFAEDLLSHPKQRTYRRLTLRKKRYSIGSPEGIAAPKKPFSGSCAFTRRLR
ncbi:MAG: hypothetical protein KDI06_16230 [Calditrichaeota bacterium]|nr:hypothetical protein [Calditrichota bacterium]